MPARAAAPGKLARLATPALAFVALAACAAREPAVTAVELPEVPRRPDGVVLEPPAAVPSSQDRAPARGVVALREPLGGEAVVTLVRAWLRAIETRREDDLLALATDEARSAIADRWRTRLKNMNYPALGGVEIARIDAIERFAYGDLEPSQRPGEMREGDLLVRVPIATTHVGSEQLFGDAMLLVLRRQGSTYRVAAYAEENGP